MRYYCIIQSRTSSVRLPAKSLLPIANLPLVVLCFKRASPSFATTIVATSSDSTDDLLSSYMENFKIPFFRGDLNNVLKRYHSICMKFEVKPDDTIIRLTADNPIVDSKFLEKMKIIWEQNNFDYFSAEPNDLKKYGWPKGLSAEFFKAESIYSIDIDNTDDYAKQHVTPQIKKFSKNSAHMANYEKFDYHFDKSYGIDSLDDYLFVATLFQGVDWNEDYDKLLEKSASKLHV